MASRPGLFSPLAIGAGVLAALAVAVPAVLIGQIVDAISDDGAGSLLFVVLGLVVVAFGVGGFVAARRHPMVPLANGAAAALGAYAVVQIIAVIRLIVAGDDVAWAAVPLFTLVAILAGVIGATVADTRHP